MANKGINTHKTAQDNAARQALNAEVAARLRKGRQPSGNTLGPGGNRDTSRVTDSRVNEVQAEAVPQISGGSVSPSPRKTGQTKTQPSAPQKAEPETRADVAAAALHASGYGPSSDTDEREEEKEDKKQKPLQQANEEFASTLAPQVSAAAIGSDTQIGGGESADAETAESPTSGIDPSLGYEPGGFQYVDTRTGEIKTADTRFPVLTDSLRRKRDKGFFSKHTHRTGQKSEWDKSLEESRERADKREKEAGFKLPDNLRFQEPEPSEPFEYPDADPTEYRRLRRRWGNPDYVIPKPERSVPLRDAEDMKILADEKEYWDAYERESRLRDSPADYVRIDSKIAKRGDEAIANELRHRLDKNIKQAFDEKSEKESGESPDPNRHRNDSKFLRKMREIRNLMIRRFMNPWVLKIEGEKVEKTVVEGVTYAKLTWEDPRVEECLNKIANLYDCTWFNVLQLIQLRAGLGIGFSGQIAKTDPDKFTMSVDHLVEFTDDIAISQKKYGHPLALVEGPPLWNNIRDDSGRFIVMAGTRCYPIGYMPKQLIMDLSKHRGSPFYGKSVNDVKRLVSESWLKDTYPALISNAKGNAMQQAYAIENQVRAMMSIDGADPDSLKIPDVVENQSMLMMIAERYAAGDEQVKAALDEKNKRLRNSSWRMARRHRKESGERNEDGSFKGAGERRENAFGDSLHGLSMIHMGAKCMNLMLWLSNPLEAVVTQAEESFGNFLADRWFAFANPEIAERHRYSDRLREAGGSAEFVEGFKVWLSLYRIGGQTAVDAFSAELDESGHRRNKWTYVDLKRWLQEIGVTSESTISDRVRQIFGIKPGDEAGFLSNVQGIMNGIEDMLLGSSDMFNKAQAGQFLKRACAEMGQFELLNMESYTSSQMEQWYAYGGGEELIDSLTRTEAGREAFQTMGIAGLGRKSPIEHLMRRVMSANGVTEFAIRTLFDRFPEYGVQKILRQIPLSNTLCYMASMFVSGIGDLTGMDAMSRVAGYQVGSRYTGGPEGYWRGFWVGFRKNLLYDMIMSGSKVAAAFLAAGIIKALGGLHEPPEEENRWTMSEWYIGEGEGAIPIKWAWWTDDLLGIALPLGFAIALMDQNDMSPESKDDAAAIFMNAVANFDDGTVVFDVIDFVHNFDEYMEAVQGANLDDEDPSLDDRARASLIIFIMDLFGDMAPTFIGQILPWSRDYIFAGDTYAHTASKVYSTDGRTRQEAEELGEVEDVDDYVEGQIRRYTANNWLAGLVMDLATGAWREDSDITSYRYGYMPLSTRADPYDLSSNSAYMQLYLDTSVDGDLPDDPDRRASALDCRAEDVLRYIREHGYDTPYEAVHDGFSLNLDAMRNCYQYCKGKYNDLMDELNERKANEGSLPPDEWNSYQQRIRYYKTLYQDWFAYGSDIPISMPRYIQQNTDYETRYVDSEGNAATWLDYVLGNAEKERYAWGNVPGIMPFSTQRTEGKAFNNETPSYHAFMDSQGNVHGDVQSMFERAEGSEVLMGRDTGSEAQELMWGGQGTNLMDDVDERLLIGSNEAPTLGGPDARVWVVDPDKIPKAYWEDDEICKALGIDPSARNSGDENSDGKDGKTKGSLSEALEIPEDDGYDYPSYNNYGGGGGSWRYYSSYSGGGSSYTPRIYSTARSTYSDRASGMGVRTPYKPTTTYLRPSYSTKGSREAYRRNDL